MILRRNFGFLSRNRHIFVLFFLYVFFVINNYIWLKVDTYPLLWDAAAHFLDSLRVFELLKGNFATFISQVTEINREYPFFVSLITAIFYKITGVSEDIAAFINGSVFLGILMLSVYGITRNLYNKSAGLLAAFLIATYPIIFAHSRTFMLDLPLTAMVCLSIYCYQESDSLRKTARSAIFGAILGLGVLTKSTFILLIACALSYYLFYHFFMLIRDTNKQGKPISGIFNEHIKQLSNFSIVLAITLVIALSWYGRNLPYLIEIFRTIPQVYGVKFPKVFTAQSLFYYFFRLVNIQISFCLFIVFILGFVFFLRAKLRSKLFPICWICLTYLVSTLIYYKSARYTLSYLPAFAIISSIGFFSIRRKALRFTLVTVIVVISTLQFYIYTYGTKLLPPIVTFPIGDNLIYLFNQQGDEIAIEQHRAPLRQDWKTADILDVISNSLAGPSNRLQNVFIIQDDPRIHSPLWSLVYLKKMPVNIMVGSWHYIADSSPDLVLNKDSNWMAPPYFVDKIKRSLKWFEENSNQFLFVEKINLPDNSNLWIYKRK